MGLPSRRNSAWILVACVAFAGTAPLEGQDPRPRPPAPVDADLAINDPWRWAAFTTRSGLPSDDVLGIVETTGGTPWVSTRRGLARYDGIRWHAVDTPGIRAFAPFGAFTPDLHGGVLVVSEGKLYRGDDDSFNAIPIEDPAGRALHVRDVAPLGGETLLIDTSSGLYRCRAGEIEPVHAPDDDDVMLVSRTRTGSVWASTVHGLHEHVDAGWRRRLPFKIERVRARTGAAIASTHATPEVAGAWTWTPGDDDDPVHAPNPGKSHVSAMDVAPDGTVLVVYASGQPWIRRGDAWELLSSVPKPLLNPNFIRFRADGDLWVCTDHGLFLCRVTSRRWTRLRQDEPGAVNTVNALLRTSAGDLWAATSDGIVVYRADGTVDRIRSILDEPLHVVTGLGEDTAGGIWVSSGANIRGAFRLHDDAWRRYGEADGLLAPRVHRIAKDRSGRLWFLGVGSEYGVDEPGAFVRDGDRFERWSTEEGLLGNRVYAFAESPGGDLWFGTATGLSRWRDDTWTHWTRADGLRSSRVFTLAVDRDERVWFGHHLGGGLGSLGRDGEIRYLDGADGLIHPGVRELRFDDDGRLWIATENGMAVLRDGHFASFHRPHGLGYPYVWPLLPEGDRVNVGTIGGGIAVLDLEEAAAGPAPEIVIAAPLIDRATALFRWSVFSPWGETASDQMPTRFRLDDGSWSPWSRTRETTAAALPPGRHTLEVQAKGLLGSIASSPSPVSFRITPPFWRHPLFAIAVAAWLLSMAVGVTLYVVRQRRDAVLLHESRGKLQEMVTSQQVLLKELNHRVRNNLASLLSLITLTHRAAGSMDEFADSMRARTQALAAAHGVLSGGQWSPIPLETLIRAIFVSELIGRFDLRGPHILVSPTRAQALGMVVSELMTNSMKYGALGASDGIVHVAWTIDDDGERVELSWTESGGPPIDGTPIPGVGTSLIEGIVGAELRGRAHLEYPREGARHVLELTIGEDGTDATSPAGDTGDARVTR